MAITKIGGRQIDVEKSPLSSSNYDSSTLKDLDGGLTLTGSVRLTHAPSNDLDAATKAYVDASTGASVSAGFVAFGDSDGSGLEGSADLKFYEIGNADLPPGAEPRLALSGAIGIGNELNTPDLLITTGTIASTDNTAQVAARRGLVLSSSTGRISLFDDGTNFGELVNDSGNLVVSQSVSDKDIIFKIMDGAVQTEVFRVDGSASSILVANGKQIQLGAAEEAISGDGANINFAVGAGGDLHIPNDIGIVFGSGSGEKIEGNGTKLDIAASEIDFTVEAGGDINVGSDIGLTFGDDGEKIEGDGSDLTIASSQLINLTATTDVVIPTGVGLVLDGSGNEKIESDGANINFAVGAGGDLHVPNNIGIVFGSGSGEKIEGDGTDLTIAGNKINLTAVADVILPENVGIVFDGDGGSAKIESDGGGINFSVTAANDITIPSNIGLEFSSGSGEKIEGDGTDLTIASSAKINLTATSDVILPDSVGMLFGDVAAGGEKIEGDGTDLTIASSAKINLTATSDVILPNSVGMLFGDVAAGGEKIEGDGTDLTVASSAKINLTATSDVILPDSVGMLFGDVAAGGEKIEGNGTDLFINSSQNLLLSASTNISIPQGVSLTFDDGGPVGAGDVIQGNAAGLLITSSYLQLGGGQQVDLSCGDGAVITLTDGAAFVNSAKTMQVQSTATLQLANGAFFSAAAGSSSTFAGAVAAGDATSFELPRYIRNTFQYTSASAAASGSVFTRLHGGANFQFNHSNDNTGAGTSEGSTFTLQATDSYNFIPTVDTFNVYLNGVRLMSGSGLDYFVTGSAVLAGTKPCLIVDFQNVLLNTGDTVVIDFQAPSA